MTGRAALELDTLTIRILMRLQRRGGRKLIMTPEGVPAVTPKPRRDDTLIKALVRAHRWRRRIESGQAKSITDLAEQEDVKRWCRILRHVVVVVSAGLGGCAAIVVRRRPPPDRAAAWATPAEDVRRAEQGALQPRAF
jgi:hypothetical protein